MRNCNCNTGLYTRTDCGCGRNGGTWQNVNPCGCGTTNIATGCGCGNTGNTTCGNNCGTTIAYMGTGCGCGTGWTRERCCRR